MLEHQVAFEKSRNYAELAIKSVEKEVREAILMDESKIYKSKSISQILFTFIF